MIIDDNIYIQLCSSRTSAMDVFNYMVQHGGLLECKSQESLAGLVGISRQQCRTAIAFLTSILVIQPESNQKVTTYHFNSQLVTMGMQPTSNQQVTKKEANNQKVTTYNSDFQLVTIGLQPASNQKSAKTEERNNKENESEKEKSPQTPSKVKDKEKEKQGEEEQHTPLSQRENKNARARLTAKPPAGYRPTLEEVREYCAFKHYTFDPERFLSHYEMVGWRYGQGTGKPIKDWHAACTTWSKGIFKPPQTPTSYPEGCRTDHILAEDKQREREKEGYKQGFDHRLTAIEQFNINHPHIGKR